VHLHSALFVVPHTQDAQAWITKFYLQLEGHSVGTSDKGVPTAL